MKGVNMSTTVAVADWIKRIADDERRRDTARIEQTAIAARKIDLVVRDGRRLVDELRAAVVRDVSAFRDEFAEDPGRDVTVDLAPSNGGFSVQKPSPSAVLLMVMPNLEEATLSCSFSFTNAGGLPPREDRIHVVFIDDGTGALRMKHNGTGKMFACADDLSEFLLVPVLTGRPR
jgi:hypothetical protein